MPTDRSDKRNPRFTDFVKGARGDEFIFGDTGYNEADMQETRDRISQLETGTPDIGTASWNATIPDNTTEAQIVVFGEVGTAWMITEDDENAPSDDSVGATPPTGFTPNPVPTRYDLVTWPAKELRYYKWDEANGIVEKLTSDGVSGILIAPKDSISPTATLTVSAGTNADTAVDWSITAADTGSGVDTTLTRLINSDTLQTISLGEASGTITGLLPATTYNLFARVTDNQGNFIDSAVQSITTAGAVSTTGTINFTETGDPYAYTVAEDAGPLTVSLTLTGRTDGDVKTCTISTRALTTDGTSQVTALSTEAVSFAAGTDPQTDTVDITLTDQSLTENNVFEVYIDDGSEGNGAAGDGDPTIGTNNAILVYLTGSGSTGTTGYEDYTDSGRQLLFLTFDDNTWTPYEGNHPDDGMSIDGSSPTAATNAVTWDKDGGGLFVNVDPYDETPPNYYAWSYNCPITLSATGTWYVWGHMYTTGTIRSTLFSFDRNQVNINQFAKTTSLSIEQWRPVGTATGSVATGYSVSAGDHNVNVATREANTTHWVDGVLITDDAAFTPSGMAYTPSTKGTGEAAIDNPDNPQYPFGPITSATVAPTYSPLDDATDVPTNAKLIMTCSGCVGIRLNPLNITVTANGGGVSGSWSTNSVDTATFTLDTGQSWPEGGAIAVTGTDIGSIVDTDLSRKSLDDIGAGDWNCTVTTPGTYVQEITFNNVASVPRDVISSDIKSSSLWDSNDWSINPTDNPDGVGDGNTLRFVIDPLGSGRTIVTEFGVAQGNGSWNFTGKVLQTRKFPIVNPSGGAILREAYMAYDIYVPEGYVAPSSVHIAGIWSAPDNSTHGTTVLDGFTRDKCRIGLNFYGILSGYNVPSQCLGLYVYHNRFTNPWYGPYFLNTVDPATRWDYRESTVGRVPIPTGRWFQFECKLKLNTFTDGAPNKDGEIKAWIDGVLACNATGQDILAEDHALGINMITHGLDYAGDSARAVQDDKIYMDNFRVSTFPMTHTP